MDPLTDVPEHFRDALKGFQSTDIVHIDSGMSVGGHSFDTDFDVGAAASLYAKLIRSSRETRAMIGMDDAPAEDLLLSTDQRYTLIRMIGDTAYAHILMVDRDSNLGVCRALMRQAEPDLLDAVQ